MSIPWEIPKQALTPPGRFAILYCNPFEWSNIRNVMMGASNLRLMFAESCRLVKGSTDAQHEVSSRSSHSKQRALCVGMDGQRPVMAFSIGKATPMGAVAEPDAV